MKWLYADRAWQYINQDEPFPATSKDIRAARKEVYRLVR
jgi:hypothetical protein